MYDLDVQIRDYIDATSAPLTVDEVLHVPVGDEPVRPFTPRGGGRRPLTGWLVAGAAAAIVVLVIGAVGVFAALRSGEESVVEPTTGTTVVEGADTSAIAESFAQARSDGDVDAVMALLAEDASVDTGPAAAPSDIPAEMRWQQATGLTFTFGRCEPVGVPTDGRNASSSCFVTWTGSVATSLGYGADTFEYAIDVFDDRIVSAALVDLGGYQETTWRPFRDWMLQQHPGDMATMYAPDGHAVLTDESIDLWRLRTTEFVEEQTGPTTTTTSSPSTPLAVERTVIDFGDTHSVTWTQLVPAAVGEPFRVFELPSHSYVAAPADAHLAGSVLWNSPDGRAWTEQSHMDPLFSDHIVEWLVGDWAATWPLEGQTSETTNMQLWNHDRGAWTLVPTPDDITQFRPPTVSGETTLIAGLGSSRQILVRTTVTEPPSVLEPSWTVPKNRPGVPFILHDADIVALRDGSFVAYVKRYDRPGEAEAGWLQSPVTIWTTTDGTDWVSRGDAAFADANLENATVYRFGEDLVAHVEFHEPSNRSETWTSSDGVTWILGASAGMPPIEGSPPRTMIATSSGLIIADEPFAVSTDGGTTWESVPGHPESPDSDFTGFSIGGLAGDLFYHSGDDGLWVGYLIQR
jgi:hypothetical protein